MRDQFRRMFEPSEIRFTTEKLHYSFRSAAEVLDAVDTVFKQPQAFRGLTSEDIWTVHQALPDAAPGEVEIWELVGPDEKDEGKEGWDAPFDTTSETSPAIKLAARVARAVKAWITQGASPPRRAHSGAPARAVLRGGDPRAQARGHCSRRRRPAHPHGAHRHHGPDGARRRIAAGGRRSGFGDGAAQPAVRLFRRPAFQTRLRTQGSAARGVARTCRRGRSLRLGPPPRSTNWRRKRG